MKTKNDVVNAPAHYTRSIEVVDFLEAYELDKDFYLGNTIKYIARAGKKDKAKFLEDLEKAAWYLLRRIKTLKAPNDTKRI